MLFLICHLIHLLKELCGLLNRYLILKNRGFFYFSGVKINEVIFKKKIKKTPLIKGAKCIMFEVYLYKKKKKGRKTVERDDAYGKRVWKKSVLNLIW